MNTMDIKAEDFDRKFEAGEDVTQYLDITKAGKPESEQRRVNVDFPPWMIRFLDTEAKHLGVPRQSLIKMLIGEHNRQAQAKKIKAPLKTPKYLKDRIPPVLP